MKRIINNNKKQKLIMTNRKALKSIQIQRTKSLVKTAAEYSNDYDVDVCIMIYEKKLNKF